MAENRNNNQFKNGKPAGNPPGNKGKLIALIIAGIILVAVSYLTARSNYPLVHSAADTVTIFIAASVFLVVWIGRNKLDNHYYLFTGIAFLFFAFFNFMHLVGNQGMGVFTHYGNLGPTFYIFYRYILGFSMLIAPVFIKRKVNTSCSLFSHGIYSLRLLSAAWD